MKRNQATRLVLACKGSSHTSDCCENALFLINDGSSTLCVSDAWMMTLYFLIIVLEHGTNEEEKEEEEKEEDEGYRKEIEKIP